MPYRNQITQAGEAWDRSLGEAEDAIDGLNQAIEDNRTRTRYVDGRAIVEQWDPDKGDWAVVNDYSREYGMLDDVLGQDWQTMEQWAQNNAHTFADGTNAWDHYQQGQQRVSSGMETLTQDYADWARDQAAQSLGFMDRGQVNELFSDMISKMIGPVSDMQGLSDEELNVYRELGHNNLRQMDAQLGRQLDAVAAGGSTMQYLAAADQVRMQMSDARLQHEYQILQTDFERKMIDYENNRQNYAMLVQMGLATEQEFLQGVRADYVNAFQAYAAGAQQVMQQRALDLEMQQAHVQTIYQGINASLGISEHAMTQAAQIYEQAVAPAREMMNAALSQANLHLQQLGTYASMQHQAEQAKAARRAARQAARGGVFRGIAQVVIGGALLFVPGGQIVGAGLVFNGAKETQASWGEAGY